MPQRNVASNFTFEQQRGEINNLANDYWTFQGSQSTLNSTWLKLDGSNAFTGGTLAVPNAFTINSNSGNGTVTISGNLQVNGTTTTVNTATMDVVDKNITIAKGSVNDAAADGAGITIDSGTDITWNFVDAKDAWVSSIGVEATTTLVAGGLASLQGARFAGTQTPSAGVGVEITQPDANTGNIQAYDRTNSAFKDLRLKGASVGFYAGSTNALVGAFHNTGLTMESGKGITIPGSLDVDGTTDLDVTNVDGALTMMAGWNLAFQNGFNNKTSAIVNAGASGKSNLEFKVDDGNGLDKRLSILNTGTVRVNKGGGIGMSLVPANNSDTFQLQFDLADTTNKGYINYDFSTDKMKFRAGGTGEQMYINNTGVGIGEDDADGNSLIIRAASTVGTKNGHIMLTGDGADVGQGPQIVFSEAGGGDNWAGGYIGFKRTGGGSVGDLVIGTRTATGDANTVPTEQLKINSGGDVFVHNGFVQIDPSDHDKLKLAVPSGSSDDWAYMTFWGEDGNRNAYVGTNAAGALKLSRDGGCNIELNDNAIFSAGAGVGNHTPTQAVLEVQGNTAYASSASTLATAVTNSAFRVKGSTNSSDSLWMGVETTDANPYIQGANDPGNATKKLLLNPFGGNVGIGTVNPGQLLEINGASSPCVLLKDTTNDVIAYLFADDSNAFVGSASNHPVIFQQNNGQAMSIAIDKQINLGTSGTNQAQFCQSGSNHYIVGQAADNVAALEVYSQHGSSASKISFGVYDNRTGSKSASFLVLGNGTVKPGSDNAQDLGTSSARWANVYTGDMHLNNMNSGGNEVDGSEGHWTMQEGADDLFLINRNTGKKYKFNLTEVS